MRLLLRLSTDLQGLLCCEVVDGELGCAFVLVWVEYSELGQCDVALFG